MGTDLESQLNRWQAAGLIDAGQAEAITAFEKGQPANVPSPASGEGQGGGPSATEVITYAGALVTLAGLGTLLGTQYQQLGPLGRLGIPGVVAVAALVVAWILPRGRARMRRAQASLLTLSVVAVALFVGQLQVELLGGPAAQFGQQTGYRIVIIASLVAAVLAAALLMRFRAGLIALAFAVSVLYAALFIRLLSNVDHGWPTEAIFLIAGIVLIGAAEYGRHLRVVWATEVLAFAGAVIPLIAAFITAGEGNLPLELFAALLAVLAFAAAVLRGSAGYAFAGGIGLFGFVLDIEFRYFRSSLGFAVSLVIAGLALLGVALLIAGILPRLRSTRP